MSPVEEKEELDCDICGEPHKCKHVHTLKCTHTFHYECIMKSYIASRDKFNQCPLCRKKQGGLPIVNGLPKLIRGIHYINEHPPEYTPGKCNAVLKSGKRKGCECGSKCMLGLNVCNRHHTLNLKAESKANAKAKKEPKKKMGLGDALEQVQVEQLIAITSNTTTPQNMVTSQQSITA